MPDSTAHILLVEDNEDHAALIARAFESHSGHTKLEVAGSIAEARALMAESTPDLVLTDYRLPDGTSTELLPGEGEEGQCPIVVMTSQGD